MQACSLFYHGKVARPSRLEVELERSTEQSMRLRRLLAEKMETARNDMVRGIGQRPMQSILMAMVAGFAVGSAIRALFTSGGSAGPTPGRR